MTKLRCPYCLKLVKKKAGLYYHIKTVHPKERHTVGFSPLYKDSSKAFEKFIPDYGIPAYKIKF